MEPPICEYLQQHTRSLLVETRVPPGCRAPCRTPARWLGRHETGAGKSWNFARNRMETNIETHGNPWKTMENPWKTHGNPWKTMEMMGSGRWISLNFQWGNFGVPSLRVQSQHVAAQSNFAWLLHWIRFWLGWFGLVGLAEFGCGLSETGFFMTFFHDFSLFSPIFTHFHQFSIMFLTGWFVFPICKAFIYVPDWLICRSFSCCCVLCDSWAEGI